MESVTISLERYENMSKQLDKRKAELEEALTKGADINRTLLKENARLKKDIDNLILKLREVYNIRTEFRSIEGKEEQEIVFLNRIF